jgi:hypothetical protein
MKRRQPQTQPAVQLFLHRSGRRAEGTEPDILSSLMIIFAIVYTSNFICDEISSVMLFYKTASSIIK